eukprot:TRINITY_DN19090_c1_g1_i1.p2 TRINITY_DN19090_c1_g1~~TRINITY_DN19090_c1_g1_i1.p2  ORF type:complete len:571 (+),score=231.88 TRINITY_DN19090_c1_g1_i1:102-1814(+)
MSGRGRGFHGATGRGQVPQMFVPTVPRAWVPHPIPTIIPQQVPRFGAGGRGAVGSLPLRTPAVGGGVGVVHAPHVGAPDFGPPQLPFGGAATRSPAEHHARNPRRPLPGDLTQVNVHWVTQKPGFLVGAARPATPIKIEAGASITPQDGDEGASSPKAGKHVNARALIFAGIQAGTNNVMLRTRFVGCRLAGGRGSSIQAYGGHVPAGTDAKVTTALGKLLEKQSGIPAGSVKQWKKLVEFEYEDKPKTVFYLSLPSDFGEEGIQPKSVCAERTEEVEVTETYTSEEEGEGDEKKKVKKTRKVKKEKVIKEAPKIRPTPCHLQELINAVPKEDDISGLELAAAGEAVDEWLRRDCALAASKVLEKKRAAAVEIADRKRKREEEIASVKKSIQDKSASMRQKWKEEDEGMTDDEKKEEGPKRQKLLQDLTEEQRRAMRTMFASLAEEERKAKPAAGAKPGPDAPKTRKVTQRNEENASAFEIFENRKGRGLHREYLATQLLAASPAATTRGKCLDICTLGGTAKSVTIDIRELTNETIEKPITPPASPKKESPKKASPKKASPKKEEEAES